jgi:hypothetical protein
VASGSFVLCDVDALNTAIGCANLVMMRRFDSGYQAEMARCRRLMAIEPCVMGQPRRRSGRPGRKCTQLRLS